MFLLKVHMIKYVKYNEDKEIRVFLTRNEKVEILNTFAL